MFMSGVGREVVEGGSVRYPSREPDRLRNARTINRTRIAVNKNLRLRRYKCFEVKKAVSWPVQLQKLSLFYNQPLTLSGKFHQALQMKRTPLALQVETLQAQCHPALCSLVLSPLTFLP